MMGGYNGSWGSMTLMMVGTTALLVILIWALVNWRNKRASGAIPPGPSALEILQQRYARGEIDTATFEQMREQLGASPRSS